MSASITYLWNCTGYALNVYICGDDCTGSAGGFQHVCSWDTLAATGTFMTYPGRHTVRFGPASARGAVASYSPVVDGSFIVNSTSGALEFTPGTQPVCKISGQPKPAANRRKQRQS